MFSSRIVVKRYGPIRRNNVNDTKVAVEEEHIEEKIEEIVDEETSTKNNKKKNKKEMANITEEQIATAELMANGLENKKVIKKDKGLIERTESSKIILTEDNRQLLND